MSIKRGLEQDERASERGTLVFFSHQQGGQGQGTRSAPPLLVSPNELRPRRLAGDARRGVPHGVQRGDGRSGRGLPRDPTGGLVEVRHAKRYLLLLDERARGRERDLRRAPQPRARSQGRVLRRPRESGEPPPRRKGPLRPDRPTLSLDSDSRFSVFSRARPARRSAGACSAGASTLPC